MAKITTTDNKPIKPAAVSAKREKQYEIVQLWQKRNFEYADPMDATDDEKAMAKYKAKIDFIPLRIANGFNLDGTPRYKVYMMNLPDSAHPKMLTKRGEVVESKFGIAISSFRIPAKMAKVIEALQAHETCWMPNAPADQPWKSSKAGKAFYVREITGDSRSALEPASVFKETQRPEAAVENYPTEDEEVVFEDTEVEELLA